MMKKILSLFLVFAIMVTTFSAFSAVSSAESYATQIPEIKEHGFITARDGAKIEYGIYGDLSKDALIMLPCNGNDMHNFDGTLLPELSKHFKVITVSPRGTGQSQRGEGELTFDVEADDLLYLLDELEIDKAHFYGFSDGGNLALVFAVKHADRVLSLIPMGANINDKGTKFTNQIGIVFEYWILCIRAYLTDDPAVKLKRDIQGMMVGQPTLEFKDLEKITAPTLNIYGESDMMYRSHSQKITESIPGARELMVKGGGHSSCFDYTHEILLPAILNFYKENGFIPTDSGNNNSSETGNPDISESVQQQANAMGYIWDPDEGVYYSATDPWQRQLGYNKYYDQFGGYVALWYDTVRVKFNYGGYDWLVQFWKGQYGFLLLGTEAGVYSKPENDSKAEWDYDDSLSLGFTGYNNGEKLLTRSYEKTSWLTGFVPGRLEKFSDRSQLTMEVRITFEDKNMRDAFVEALQEQGVGFCEGNATDADTYRIDGNDVYLMWKTDRNKTS